MKDKAFIAVVIALLLLGTASTAALALYTHRLQQESSLTAFIASEEAK